MSNSPLSHLTHPLPFDLIHPSDLEECVDQLLEEAQNELTDLENLESATYFSFFTAYDRLGNRLEDCLSVCSQLKSLLGTSEWREVYQKIQPKVSAFYARIPFSEKMYTHIKTVASSPDLTQLSAPQQRYVQQTLQSFQRNGAELKADDKATLEKIEIELSELTLTFGKHVVEATDSFEYIIDQERDLAGLPDHVKQAAKASAKSKGLEGWRFTLQGPSYIGLMTYLDQREIRKHFYTAYTTRATHSDQDNRSLIEEILTLRHRKAHLLGYAHVADLFLESRMVKTGQRALDFVNSLTQRTQTAFEKEHQELSAFAQTQLGWTDDLQAWDVGYVAEKYKKYACGFDETLLRPYLELNQVLKGLFSIVERLYQISIRPVSSISKWHDDVKTFEILDQDQKQIGLFYADLFAREGKQGGAWMCPLLYGHTLKTKGVDPQVNHSTQETEVSTPHVGLISCNFSPPLDHQAFITHREMETLFHECGHLLHHLMTQATIRSQAGTNVAWDFVELPSQIMENWCWERDSLDLLAKHHDTQAPLPNELFDTLMKTRTFRQASGQMRQLCFASTDLYMHIHYATQPDLQKQGIMKYAHQHMSQFSATPLPSNYAMIAAFGHLFASPVGYAAAYYSYKWAEVLDADAFSRFKNEGLFSPEVGQAFLDQILSRGDEVDPLELYIRFMGREPKQDALFERLGLGA
jgi:oligopeptidase A